MRTNAKFPHVSSYLARLDDDAKRAMLASVPPSSLVAAVMAFPLVVIVAGMIFGGWVAGMLLGLGMSATIVAILTGLNRQKKLATDPREQRKREVFRAGRELKELEDQRKLHRWMDPVALHLLEAGATHWARIHATLKSPQWNPRELPSYWSQLKEQVYAAADQGMADLLLLTQSCVGPPQKDRESDVKGIFQSFVDLDIADALQGLSQMAKSDWTAYAHQSPQSQAVAQHGRLIAERLRDLADDIEAKSAEVAVHSATLGGLTSLEALDGVLGELKTVRQAESELEQRIGNGF